MLGHDLRLVFGNQIRYFQRKLQCFAPGLAVYAGDFVCQNAGHKVGYFVAQGVGFLVAPGLRLKGFSTFLLAPIRLRIVMILHVNVMVSVVFEYPQLSFLFHADAAGRNIGDAAVGKMHSDVGDVCAGVQYRDSFGQQRCHRAVHQAEYIAEVMNHQIQYDVDVHISVAGWHQADGFNEHRRSDIFTQVAKRWIKLFNVSHLQQAIFLSRQCDQGICFGNGGGNGLFDQDMNPGGKAVAGNLKMRAGWGGYADRFCCPQEFGVIRQRSCVAAFRYCFATFRVNINDGGKVAVLKLLVLLGVVLPEASHPNYGALQFTQN